MNESGPSTPSNELMLSRSERRQRAVAIGLGVAGGFVLVLGVIAFVATRGDGADGGSVPLSTTPAVTVTEPPPSTSTSTSTSTTTTTTGAPIPAVADAGMDLDVDRGAEVALVANGLSDGTPDAAVRWTQTTGPDVTGGSGALSGAVATFLAPADVSTLSFSLEVAGTDGVASDEVNIRVFEDATSAAFVDGERGDDGGDGTRAEPYRTLGRAVAVAAGRDLYVRSVGTYDESAATLELDSATSVYGGYDDNWLRDPLDRAEIAVAAIGLRITGSEPGVLSAIEVLGRSDGAAGEARAVLVDGPSSFAILDSRIVAADVAAGSGLSSVGVVAENVGEFTVSGSTINAGRGGRGSPGPAPEPGARSAVSGGGAATEVSGGRGGVGSAQGAQSGGGDGGDGGISGNGSSGQGGAAGGTSDRPDGAAGGGGPAGDGGSGGDGAGGYVEGTTLGLDGEPGSTGGFGGPGGGGGGGGGGHGPLLIAGGGGGGGSGGSDGGAGGLGGHGGGASVALLVEDVGKLRLVESTIAAALGGAGGPGSAGLEPFEGGGRGGPGDVGSCDFIFCNASGAGAGGGGGGGGSGGVGGMGGGGGGGPSIGLYTAGVDIVHIESSNIRGGAGGAGAAGGSGGTAGSAGTPGSGRSGGEPGAGTGDGRAGDGLGAAGGPSVGWFDAGAATQDFDDAVIEAGPPGPGGNGREPGADGVAVSRNV